MYLNIVTPCSRPENLHTISESINIPKDNYRWIVVYDGTELPNVDLVPNNCEIYNFFDSDSVFGMQQRKFALNLIEHGHIYFNDDDTIIHPELWENIKDLENDFIHFNQDHKDGSPRLHNYPVKVDYIDSHNFIVSKDITNGINFVNRYDADGMFAIECVNACKSYIHIPKVLSIYNSLR